MSGDQLHKITFNYVSDYKFLKKSTNHTSMKYPVYMSNLTYEVPCMPTGCPVENMTLRK